MMVFLIILASILLLIVIILGYISINLYNKVQLLISFLEQRENDYAIIDFLEKILKIVKDGQDRLNRVDQKGSFKTDDEVGFIFNSIKHVVDDLTEKIKFIYEETKILEGKINVEIVRERETVKTDKEKK